MLEYDTPLIHAVRSGVADAVREELFSGGSSVDERRMDGRNETPLWIASYFGYENVVRLLLERGALVDLARDDGATPLFMACVQGHKIVAQLLLEHDAAADHANNDGITPLFVAIMSGHENVVRVLLEGGATVDLASNNGVTPLLLARRRGHLAIVQLLCSHGANRTSRATRRRTSPTSTGSLTQELTSSVQG